MEFFSPMSDYSFQNYDPRSSYSPASSSTGSDSVNLNMDQLKLEGATYTNLDTYNNEESTGIHLRVTQQPVDKFRFRYKSEMHGTHGALMGALSTKSRKIFPTAELKNYNGNAIIQCSLYQADPTRKMHHSHKLVVRHDNVDIEDPHRISVGPQNGYQAVFKGMGIIHTAKKHIKEELFKKLKNDEESKGVEISLRRENQLMEKAERESKSMNLNQVCLCFEALVENPNGCGYIRLCDPVYSKCINNMKSALTGELKICRLSTAVSSAGGQDDLFLFVEKVGKKNIKVKFFELDDENDAEIWVDWGIFTEIDVHHQYAIALKTPPYRNPDITSPVDVYIQLFRPSDEDYSEPMPFKYKPRDITNSRKRQRPNTSSFNSSDLPLVLNRMNPNPMPLIPQASGSAFPEESQIPQPPMAISEEINKMQMINDLLPSNNDECTFSGISSLDLTELITPSLTYDGEVKASGSKEAVGSILQINQECDKIFQTVRLFGNNKNNSSGVLTKVTGLVESYFQRTNESLIHHIFKFADENRLRQLLQIIGNYQLYSLAKAIDQETNYNLLHLASVSNKHQYIRSLINFGVNPSQQCAEGNTPLHLAVFCNSVDSIKALLSGNCNPQVFNNDGFTALHVAIKSRNMEITKLLLDKGFSSVATVDRKQGNNALHMAVLNKDVDMCKLILKSPDNEVTAKNSSSYSSIEIANIIWENDKNNEGIKEIAELLKGVAADEDIPMENNKVLEIKEEKSVIGSSRSELESILNTNHKWRELAQSLKLDHITHVCENSENPASVLLNFVEMESIDEITLKEEIEKLLRTPIHS